MIKFRILSKLSKLERAVKKRGWILGNISKEKPKDVQGLEKSLSAKDVQGRVLVGKNSDEKVKLFSEIKDADGNAIMTSDFAKVNMFRTFFANNNPSLEKTLKTADFAKFKTDGIPLKYPRKDYIKDLDENLKDFNQDEIGKIEKYFQFKKTDIGFEQFPQVPKEPYPRDFTEQMIKSCDKIGKDTQKFTLENETTVENPELKAVLDGIIKGMPEFTTIVGKIQHETHAYSVDIHTLEVLQRVMNDNLYKTLSNRDKTVLKIAAVIHDFGKRGGVVDKGHAALSGRYALKILSKYKLPDDVKNRIIEMVLNHHWFEGYNRGFTTPQEVAARFRTVENYTIARIFAKADFASVNNRFHLKKMGVSDENEYDALFQEKTDAVLQIINKNMPKS